MVAEMSPSWTPLSVSSSSSNTTIAGFSLRADARTAPASSGRCTTRCRSSAPGRGYARARPRRSSSPSRGRSCPGTRGGSRGPVPLPASPRCPAGARSRSACRCGRRTSRPCPCACRPAPSARRCPAARPASTLLVPTYETRFDLGASESWQITGIFSATRSSSGVIESGLTGLTAMPWNPRPSRPPDSAAARELALERAKTSALMPNSCSAFWMPLTAMFQKPAELLVTNANLYFVATATARCGRRRLRRSCPTPYFLLQPIGRNAAARTPAGVPIPVIGSSIICHGHTRVGQLVHLLRGFKRGTPRIEDAHITQACRPRSLPARACFLRRQSKSATSSASMA